MEIKFKFKIILMFIFITIITIFYINNKNNNIIGQENSNCIRDYYFKPLLNNSNNLVITSYNTFCTTLFTNSVIYIHLHKIDEEDTINSLIFRYDPSDFNDENYPTIQWLSNNKLSIKVYSVSQITKKLNFANGVNIEYIINKKEYPDLD